MQSADSVIQQSLAQLGRDLGCLASSYEPLFTPPQFAMALGCYALGMLVSAVGPTQARETVLSLLEIMEDEAA